MGYKVLELNIISAKDLKNVNFIGKMDVYVIVSLSGDSKSKQKTPVHQDGGTCPIWNHMMKFSIDESVAVHQKWVLIFQLRHEHTFGSDKNLGEVRVPVSELFGSGKYNSNNMDPQFVTYQVKKPSGRPQGELKFSYKVLDMADGMMSSAGQKMNHPNHHSVVDAYPPNQSCSSSSYHPPAGQSVTAAPYPPTAGVAYPPPPAGYPPQQGYTPQQGGYPPQQGGYPPQQGGYPPQQGGHYPPPPVGYPAAQGYPLPQYGGYPPQSAGGQGYGGYPPQAGYSQMQQPQNPAKNKKSNKLGMGLGAGLLGGALGGLVLGEALEDIGDFDC